MFALYRYACAVLLLSSCTHFFPEQSAEWDAGWIATPGGSAWASFQPVHGRALVGNDMLFDRSTLPGDMDLYAANGAVYADAAKWPNGVIPYAIGQDVAQAAAIEQVVAQWNAVSQQTGVRWVPRAAETGYVSFVGGPNCTSEIGYAPQPRVVTTQCASLADLMHVTGHIVGMLHEQQRPDANQFLSFHANHILPAGQRAFAPIQGANLATPFDFSSIMLYNSFRGSNGGPAITTKAGGMVTGGQTLSPSDIIAVAKVYGGTAQNLVPPPTVVPQGPSVLPGPRPQAPAPRPPPPPRPPAPLPRPPQAPRPPQTQRPPTPGPPGTPLYACADGRWSVQQQYVCDGANDCADGSDEAGCPSGTTPPAVENFKCANGNEVSPALVCDGQNDCGDGSDEAGCPSGATPPAVDNFKCANGNEVSPAVVCNGTNDCGDGSDEAGCAAGTAQPPVNGFQCANGTSVPQGAVCNGQNDCGDGSDEVGCPADTPTPPAPGGGIPAPGGGIPAPGAGIPAPGGDTPAPPASFQCANGTQVSPALVCNGADDCGDGTDEAGCPGT